jgi:hypothetical protein
MARYHAAVAGAAAQSAAFNAFTFRRTDVPRQGLAEGVCRSHCDPGECILCDRPRTSGVGNSLPQAESETYIHYIHYICMPALTSYTARNA